jgi:hypothetical protein
VVPRAVGAVPAAPPPIPLREDAAQRR